MISLFKRFVIVVAVVIAITDTVVFYHIEKGTTTITLPFVILVIIVTIIPIVVNLWYWLVFKQGK
jgi:hypothetical protein